MVHEYTSDETSQITKTKNMLLVEKRLVGEAGKCSLVLQNEDVDTLYLSQISFTYSLQAGSEIYWIKAFYKVLFILSSVC